MLLNQQVDVKINSLNQNHYDELYLIPKKWSKSNRRYVISAGTQIKVNVEHLTKGCGSVIKYKCDNCNNIYETIYHRYFSKAKPEGNDLCKKCYRKLYPFGKHIHNWGFGENAPNWNPNMTDDDRTYRDTPEYKEFIKECLKRDKYICQISGQIGGELEVHHIKSYARYPELRIDISNGIVLSKEIHREFHKKYGKFNFTENDFNNFRMEKLNA